MTLVSLLCITHDGCHSHADDVMRLIVTQMMIDVLTNMMSLLYGGFLTWPGAGGLNEGYWGCELGQMPGQPTP